MSPASGLKRGHSIISPIFKNVHALYKNDPHMEGWKDPQAATTPQVSPAMWPDWMAEAQPRARYMRAQVSLQQQCISKRVGWVACTCPHWLIQREGPHPQHSLEQPWPKGSCPTPFPQHSLT